jgi:hypothetical protein
MALLVNPRLVTWDRPRGVKPKGEYVVRPVTLQTVTWFSSLTRRDNALRVSVNTNFLPLTATKIFSTQTNSLQHTQHTRDH